MAKYTDEEKKFWYQTFTLQGRMFYPDLLEAKAGSNGRLKFGLLFAWDYNSNANEVQKIGQFLATAKSKYHPQIPDQYWNNPVKKFDTYQRTDGRPNHEFLRNCYFMNLSTGLDMPPVVVGSNRMPVIDKAEIYGGRNCVISFTFWLNNGGKDGTGKKGVGANINAVMLLPGGEKEGGSSTAVNINEIFGSFSADMGAPPAQPAYNPQQPAQPAYNPQQPAQPAYNPQQPAQPAYNPQQWPPTNNNGGY